MVHVTMRVPPHVYEYYNKRIASMRDALVKHTEEQIQWQTHPSEPSNGE
jgi:hypothetical protein